MCLGNIDYYTFLIGCEWRPHSYKEMAVKEMYYAIVNEDNIQFLFLISNLLIFSFCRCHLVVQDGSTANEHLHALVQYQKGTYLALNKRMQRAGLRFQSKTKFKQIIFPDHAVGVMGYIFCEDGQRQKKTSW